MALHDSCLDLLCGHIGLKLAHDWLELLGWQFFNYQLQVADVVDKVAQIEIQVRCDSVDGLACLSVIKQ